MASHLRHLAAALPGASQAAQKRLEELRALAELARRQAAARKANEKEGRRLQEQGTSRAPPIPPEEPAKDATGAQPAHGVPSSPPAAVPSQSRHTIERAGTYPLLSSRKGSAGPTRWLRV